MNSFLTHLDLGLCLWYWMNWTWLSIVIHSMSNQIGDSGASSLSEALKVNSSLTHLELGIVFMILNDMFIIINCHSFHDDVYWWIRKKSSRWCSWIKHHNHSNLGVVMVLFSSISVFVVEGWSYMFVSPHSQQHTLPFFMPFIHINWNILMWLRNKKTQT